MEAEKILKEIKLVKTLLSTVVGTQELTKREQFSKEALRKAASEFRKLQITRGEWVLDREISKVIRSAPYSSGQFIIEKFGFTNYFKKGRSYYFNRKDLVALNKELKARKINLATYMELDEDKEKFNKYVLELKQGKKKRPRFKIPENLENIETQPYNHPPKEQVLAHIQSLMDEYEKDKLVEFIDIYDGPYAVAKHIFHFDRYLDKDLKKQCAKWCFEFNYAQKALKEIKKIRSQVIY